jgi:hypothetical protein
MYAKDARHIMTKRAEKEAEKAERGAERARTKETREVASTQSQQATVGPKSLQG